MNGPLYRDQHIAVINLPGQGLVSEDVRPPKIIVGISITLTDEPFQDTHLIFPAVLDTGCNKAFEIDERHLRFWNATPKDIFPLLHRRHRPIVSHAPYDIRKARIWVHLEPYTGPRFRGGRRPLPLYVSDEIRVMDGAAEPRPRFPLLGMDALVLNNLQLFVDGRSSTFALYD